MGKRRVMGYSHILFIAMVFIVSTSSAISPVEITINPESQIVELGQELTINISIDPVNNPISAAQFSLLFNNSSLEVRNITEGSLFRQNGTNTMFNSGYINNTGGALTYVWGLIITPGANVTAKGNLATITMYTKDTGISLINLTDIIVSDPDSQAVQIDITNGSIKVSANRTVPSASITNLQNISYAKTYINWTWTDPLDTDFAKVMIYLNGIFQTNITNGIQYYNATGLIPNKAYTISTRTVDTSGNINLTWVNHTAHTALTPAIDYYIPFLYQRSDNIYDAGVQVQNNGSIQANIEIQFYYLNGTSAGNGTFSVRPGELLTKHAFDITGTMPVYVGPAAVRSDIPVQVQGYIKTMSEGVYSIASSFTNTATRAYIPFLYQRADNMYDAGVMAFNPGDTKANITIKMYYQNGTLAAQNTFQVGPKAEVSKYAFDIVTGQSIFVGPAEITSDQPIVAQGFIRTKTSMIYSIAPSVSTTVLKAYLPFLYQRADNMYDAGVMAFNPGSVAANVTINMYYLNGSIAGSGTYQVGAKAEVSKYAFDIVTGESVFVGPAEIISDQPVIAQGFIRTKASMVYSIAPQVRKPISAGEAHVPFLYQTVNASHDAGIMAMNPNSVPANIGITLYYPNGTKAGNVSVSVGPNAELSKYAFDIAPNIVDFDGSAVVTADQPIVAQGFIRKKSSMIYSIAPSVER